MVLLAFAVERRITPLVNGVEPSATDPGADDAGRRPRHGRSQGQCARRPPEATGDAASGPAPRHRVASGPDAPAAGPGVARLRARPGPSPELKASGGHVIGSTAMPRAVTPCRRAPGR